MKYLLVIALILLVVGLWRHNRKAEGKPVNKAPAQLPATEIVACAVCQVHLPKSEALPGPNGYYCGQAHRRQAKN